MWRDTPVKYRLKRWKQSKDWSDWIRSGRAQATTPKQDEQIISLAEQQTFVSARNMANNLKKIGATVNERMAFERSSNQIQSTVIKVTVLTEVHRKNCLKWAQGKTKLRIGNRWSFQKRQSFSKMIGMELEKKKEDRSNRQAFD